MSEGKLRVIYSIVLLIVGVWIEASVALCAVVVSTTMGGISNLNVVINVFNDCTMT